MKKITFNRTELTVSEICLGTANFGTARSVEECFAQMDLFSEAGGNFMDTALVYGDWAWPERGRSEQVIGQWLTERKVRDQVVISTKGCHPPAEDMSIPRVSRGEIISDVELSLQNLQTDYIDLYFLHRDNPKIPVAEILETLEEQVKKGKIRYYGCSNWKLDRVKEAAAYAKEHELQGFSCNQIMMALTDVDMSSQEWTGMQILDEDFYACHKESGLNLMAFQCLSGGYFSKRLAGKTVSEMQKAMYDCAANDAMLEKLKGFEKDGYDPLVFSLQYVKKAGFPAIPITAFSSEEQLKKMIALSKVQVPKEMLDELIALKKVQKYIW